MKWIGKKTHEDIHIKLKSQEGLGRRGICCFKDLEKKKQELVLEEGIPGEVIL